MAKTVLHSINPSRPRKVFFNDNHLDEHQGTDFRKANINIIKELREFK